MVLKRRVRENVIFKKIDAISMKHKIGFINIYNFHIFALRCADFLKFFPHNSPDINILCITQ